jgi:hypothetical protein
LQSNISESGDNNESVNIVSEEDEDELENNHGMMMNNRGPGRRGAKRKGFLKDECKVYTVNDIVNRMM